MDEIAHLHLYFTQTAATLEYDGVVVQDLSVQVSLVLTHIGALEATVMVQPQADKCSAGWGMSNSMVVSAEHSRNFGDCSDRSCDGE